MNDFVSRTTFGFVMSQLFPGAIAVFSISFAYQAVEMNPPNAVIATASQILKGWNDAPVAHQLFLLGFCVGFGMFIHALNWAILGALEHQPHRVFDSGFHRRTIAPQVLGAPVRAIFEIGVLLFKPKQLREARMKENASDIHQDFMRQFEFIQDFYLYSAQFFAHTTLALLVAFSSVVIFIANYGLTGRRLTLLTIIYVAAGAFFVLGRIQLASLFNAEVELTERSETSLGTKSPLGMDDLVVPSSPIAAENQPPTNQPPAADPKLHALDTDSTRSRDA